VSGSALLHVDSLSMHRSDQAVGKRLVLDALNLTLFPASTVALIGPSGSGKSTLLRLLNRLEDPDAGQIYFSGQNINEFSPLELRCLVGLVLQKPFMFPGSVSDNLIYSFKARGLPLPSDEEIEKVSAVCAIASDMLQQPARKLSVGQQQRVSLARTLLNRPKLLLLDEPTSSLDPDTADLVLRRLVELTRQDALSLLIVTHDHQLARRHADRIFVMQNGSVVEQSEGADHAKN